MSTPESFGDESASLHSQLQFRILKSKQGHSVIRAYPRMSESNWFSVHCERSNRFNISARPLRPWPFHTLNWYRNKRKRNHLSLYVLEIKIDWRTEFLSVSGEFIWYDLCLCPGDTRCWKALFCLAQLIYRLHFLSVSYLKAE